MLSLFRSEFFSNLAFFGGVCVCFNQNRHCQRNWVFVSTKTRFHPSPFISYAFCIVIGKTVGSYQNNNFLLKRRRCSQHFCSSLVFTHAPPFLKQFVKNVCVKEEHFVRSAMIMNAINEKLKGASSQGTSAN